MSRRSALAATLMVAIVCCGDTTTTTTTTTIAEVTTPQGTTPVATAVAPDTEVTSDSEEIRFTSGEFELVGSLVLPEGKAPFGAVVVVAGSGPQTRASTPGYSFVSRSFRDAGFAVFSWDKPGSGGSTGVFDEEQGLRQRATILADGIATLAEHPAIDEDRIGLWGLSQAGWVMPLALELTDSIAFMIAVSGGGEDSIEQLAYQIAQDLVCDGLSPEAGELIDRYGPQAAKGPTYEAYAEAMEILLDIPETEPFVGSAMSSEEEWQPWPPEIDSYFDPMDVIRRTTIPVLAVFGELDKNIDPIQGAAAYDRALAAAGNPNYHVELIPGVGHTMFEQRTGCRGEPPGQFSERYSELLEEWVAMLAEEI